MQKQSYETIILKRKVATSAVLLWPFCQTVPLSSNAESANANRRSQWRVPSLSWSHTPHWGCFTDALAGGSIAWICCRHHAGGCWKTAICTINTSQYRDLVLPRRKMWNWGLSYKATRVTGQTVNRAAKESQIQPFCWLLMASIWVPIAASKIPVTVIGKGAVSATTIQYFHALSMKKMLCRTSPVLC